MARVPQQEDTAETVAPASVTPAIQSETPTPAQTNTTLEQFEPDPDEDFNPHYKPSRLRALANLCCFLWQCCGNPDAIDTCCKPKVAPSRR